MVKNNSKKGDKMEGLKEFKSNLETLRKTFKACRDAYVMAKAYHMAVLEVDRLAKKNVLDRHSYNSEDEGERITDPRHDYRMSDKDFSDYVILCHLERTKLGLKIPSSDLTSDYQSHKLLRIAEENFVNVSLLMLPQKMRDDLARVRDHYEHRQEFIKLQLSLAI